MIISAFIIWIGIFAAAFINGAMREILMIKTAGMNPRTAHKVSCVSGIILWTAFAWLTWDFLSPESLKEAGLLGIFWFLLTLAAETFIINKLMSHMSWKQILQTYDIRQGEFWGIVLLWIGIMPVIIYLIRQPILSALTGF